MWRCHITTANSKIVKSNITGVINYQTKQDPMAFKKLGPHKYYYKYPIMCINEYYRVNLFFSGLKINNATFEFKPLSYKLKCREKKPLSSFTESIDTNQLIIKNSAIEKYIKKKPKKNTVLLTLFPIFSTFLALFIISVLLLQVFSHKRKKNLDTILENLHKDEEEEENDGENTKKDKKK